MADDASVSNNFTEIILHYFEKLFKSFPNIIKFETRSCHIEMTNI